MWSVAAGTFPPGLSLTADGTVSGTNSIAGGFSFTVSVADSAGQSITGPAKVTVYAAMTVNQLCAARCSIGAGCRRCGGFGSAGGGLGPYSYRISGGAVPPGMTWSALSVGGAFLAGNYSLLVLVSDSAGGHVTVGANWYIYSPARLTAGGSCSAAANPPYCTAARWSYSGGHPTVAPKVVILGYSQYCAAVACFPTPTGPPPGWSAIARGGTISISAGPILCNTPNYQGYVTLALVDTTTCATTSQSNAASLLVNLQQTC